MKIIEGGKEYVIGRMWGDFDTVPVPRMQAAAQYSAKDLAGAKEGVAIVHFTLKANGSTADFASRGANKALSDAALPRPEGVPSHLQNALENPYPVKWSYRISFQDRSRS